MENIYPPNKFPCTDNIPLKRYFTELSALCLNQPDLKKNGNKADVDDAILDSLQIFDEHSREELMKACSVDLLTISQDRVRRQSKQAHPIIKAAKNLETVRVRGELRNKINRFYKHHKAHQQEKLKPQVTKKRKAINVEPKEFAVAIRVYQPFTLTIPADVTQNSYKKLKFSHEIVVLGSNTLADLRDKILCTADAGICVEIDDLPAEPPAGNAKDKYPSGFIFIDDVFYNDTRHGDHIDYSEVILQWAAGKGIGPLRTDILQTTKIAELSPRFGYPYVYQHQATCEHILVFSDAWLLSGNNPLNTKDYPCYREMYPQGHKTCALCYSSQAKWICADSDRLPHTIFICKGCLMQYNYRDGKKIGIFKIFPYFNQVVPVVPFVN